MFQFCLIRVNIFQLLSLIVIFWIIICYEDKFVKGFNKSIVSTTDTQRWICKESNCESVSSHANQNTSEAITKAAPLSSESTVMSFETCNILCPSLPPVWPKPKQIEIDSKDSTAFQSNRIFLKISTTKRYVKRHVEKAANLFMKNLLKQQTNRQQTTESYLIDSDETDLLLNLHINVINSNMKLSLRTNESYNLTTIKHNDHLINVNITAETFFGARHGLETLNQLIWYDHLIGQYRIVHNVLIVDEPKFAHRGLLIDVARNFFPVNLLKKAIDGMAASKLNVLHLHASDSESFPLILPNNQQFAQNGAYQSDMTYTPRDIKELNNYALIRGVRLILEIDAPSHVNVKAWPSDHLVCGDKDIFKATLNPDNEQVFSTLQRIYKDLLLLGTADDSFHIGNDEVNLKCWINTKAAMDLVDLKLLWANFTNKMIDQVVVAHNNSVPDNIVLWSSPLTDYYLYRLNHQNNLVIQYWYGRYEHILLNNYKIIFSTVGQWYLDCGFGPWKMKQENGACSPYTHWLKFYKYRPWENYQTRLEQILGGEVCLWSEQVSPEDLETRLWPRASAFAERVWNDPDRFDRNDVFQRFDIHANMLRLRGLHVAAIWPKYCSLHPNQC